MDKIIATIIVLIVVIGLIAYAILPQAEGVKEIGDEGLKSQKKITQLLEDPNKVTGATAQTYVGRSGVSVTLDGKNVSDANEFSTSGVYQMEKTYKKDGSLSEVSFTVVDLSK